MDSNSAPESLEVLPHGVMETSADTLELGKGALESEQTSIMDDTDSIKTTKEVMNSVEVEKSISPENVKAEDVTIILDTLHEEVSSVLLASACSEPYQPLIPLEHSSSILLIPEDLPENPLSDKSINPTSLGLNESFENQKEDSGEKPMIVSEKNSVPSELDMEINLVDTGNVSGDALIPKPNGDLKTLSHKVDGTRTVVNAQTLMQGDTPEMPLFTILEPKAQRVDKVCTQNDNLSSVQAPQRCFITDVIGRQIDLGDKAELVEDLIYWRDPKTTGLIFVSVLGLLLSLQIFSLISVMAYLSLAVVSCGLICRAYCTSQGTPTVNPILVLNPAVSEDNIRKLTDITAFYVNDTILIMRRLYLAENVSDSIKFAFVLWYLTYVGSWFNGMTVIIISFVTIFTVPTIYEYNKEQIDRKLTVCWDKWNKMSERARVRASGSQISVDQMSNFDMYHH